MHFTLTKYVNLLDSIEDTPEDKGDDLWSVDSKGIYRIYDLLKTASELPDDVVSARSLASREDGDEVRYSTTLVNFFRFLSFEPTIFEL